MSDSLKNGLSIIALCLAILFAAYFITDWLKTSCIPFRDYFRGQIVEIKLTGKQAMIVSHSLCGHSYMVRVDDKLPPLEFKHYELSEPYNETP